LRTEGETNKEQLDIELILEVTLIIIIIIIVNKYDSVKMLF